MSERSQRTTIRFGGVRAEVALYKTSGKPTAAKYETRRVAAEPKPEPDDLMANLGLKVEREAATPGGRPIGVAVGDAELRDFPVTDPETGEPTGEVEQAMTVDVATSGTFSAPGDAMGEAIAAAESRDAVRRGFAGPEADPLGDAPVPPPASAPPVVPMPETTVQQGVTRKDGAWIDLTERLKQVDEATKLEGMEVVATIAVNSIHRERVRDAHYIAAGNTDQQQYKVLALLWHGLRETGRAAVVRWTKRTQQALGIIVARGSLNGAVAGEGAHLLLLELEWQENMRAVPPRALGPIVNGDPTDAEIDAAISLVNAFTAGPAALNELRDERLGKRADLLTLAREGRLDEYVPPVAPAEDVAYDDLAAAFAASAAALR